MGDNVVTLPVVRVERGRSYIEHAHDCYWHDSYKRVVERNVALAQENRQLKIALRKARVGLADQPKGEG